MLRSLSKRRALDRAIPLVETVKERHAHQISNQVRVEAFAARAAMDDAADLYVRAHAAHLNDERVKCQRMRDGAALDHRLACDHLYKLALAMRDLIQWAAADWRPSVDVQGTGLRREELFILCEMMGCEEAD